MKTEKNFRQVDWDGLAEQVKMSDTQRKISNCHDLELEMDDKQIINLRTSTLDKNQIEQAYSASINSGFDQTGDSFG